mmetsp:Transcript_63709/g.168363  ORF Transcript_63709/g.168363 Transcript_63709/m.168363 type:complete len:219 (-) Transcript_63709:1535-2191(-)
MPGRGASDRLQPRRRIHPRAAQVQSRAARVQSRASRVQARAGHRRRRASCCPFARWRGGCTRPRRRGSTAHVAWRTPHDGAEWASARQQRQPRQRRARQRQPRWPRAGVQRRRRRLLPARLAARRWRLAARWWRLAARPQRLPCAARSARGDRDACARGEAASELRPRGPAVGPAIAARGRRRAQRHRLRHPARRRRLRRIAGCQVGCQVGSVGSQVG